MFITFSTLSRNTKSFFASNRKLENSDKIINLCLTGSFYRCYSCHHIPAGWLDNINGSLNTSPGGQMRGAVRTVQSLTVLYITLQYNRETQLWQVLKSKKHQNWFWNCEVRIDEIWEDIVMRLSELYVYSIYWYNKW